ncbi:hypothetical protein H0H93_007110 [Arthromyces matolae]|nr:hypothetical protein H0H93_007110 [Arthromyces matolae]
MVVEGPFYTPENREAADTYIRKQIAAHEKIICYYKRRRNALTVACRFPPEILAIIFEEVKHLQIMKDLEGWSWVPNVSHVCSHWREVALASCKLWSDLPVDSKKWAREMIRRSGKVPLTVRFNDGRRTNKRKRVLSALNEILTSYLHRIKHLVFHSHPLSRTFRDDYHSYDAELRECVAHLRHHAPTMETLDISFSCERNDSLPKELFLPQLRHLKLVYCGIPQDIKLSGFKNLQSIYIQCGSSGNQPLTMSFMVALLRQTPLLKHLTLRNLVENFVDLKSLGIPPPRSHTYLEHLETLDVQSDMPSCVFLVAHIVSLPKIRTSRVVFQHTSQPFHLFQQILEKLDENTTGSISKLHFHTAESIDFYKSTNTASTSKMSVTHAKRTLSYRSQRHVVFETVDPVLSSLRLDQLQSLHVDIRIHIEAWTFFGELAHLKELQVNSNESALLAALSLKVNQRDGASACLSFVALRTLSISNWHVTRSDTASEKILMESLIACLSLRRKSGSTLDRLQMDHCTGTKRRTNEEIWSRLESCVSEVIITNPLEDYCDSHHDGIDIDELNII